MTAAASPSNHELPQPGLGLVQLGIGDLKRIGVRAHGALGRHLAGAAAGRGFVRQAAPALHEAMQRGACAGEALAMDGGGDALHGTGLLRFQAEDDIEHIGEATGRIEAHQHRLGAGDGGATRLQPVFGGEWLRALALGDGQAGIQPLGQRIERHLPPARAAGAGIEQVVGRDAMDPGAERALAAPGGEMGGDLEQDFLGCVLGIGPVAEHADGKRVERCLEGAEQRLQSGEVAAPCAPDQGRVGREAHGAIPRPGSG